MPLSKTDFELIRASIGSAINGDSLPSLHSVDAGRLIAAVSSLADDPRKDFFAALGSFAVARLVDRHAASVKAERELAMLLPKFRN